MFIQNVESYRDLNDRQFIDYAIGTKAKETILTPYVG